MLEQVTAARNGAEGQPQVPGAAVAPVLHENRPLSWKGELWPALAPGLPHLCRNDTMHPLAPREDRVMSAETCLGRRVRKRKQKAADQELLV